MRITTPAGTTVSLISDGYTAHVAMQNHDEDMPVITGHLDDGTYAHTNQSRHFGPNVLRAIANLIEETQK